jgi:hypothetical protein
LGDRGWEWSEPRSSRGLTEKKKKKNNSVHTTTPFLSYTYIVPMVSETLKIR